MKNILKNWAAFGLLLFAAACNLEKIDDLGNSGNGIRPAFTYTVDGCSAPFTVQFQNQSTGALGYQWTFASLGSSDLDNPSFVFNTPGTYTVALKATNNALMADTTITLQLQGSTRFEIPSYAPGNELRVNTNIVQMADGAYIVAGRNNAFQVYLYKCNSSGVKVYDKSFGSAGLYFPREIVKTPDGELIVGGTINTTSTKKYFLMRFSADGVLKKETLFSTAVYENDDAFGLTVLADGSILLLGRTPSGFPGNTEDMLVLHLDAAFNIKKETTIDLGFSERVTDVLAEDNKNITVFVFASNGGDPELRMVKIELTNYSITDNKNLAALYPDLGEINKTARTTNTPGYILAGTAKTGAAYLLHINKNGSKISEVKYENGGFFWVNTTPDHGFVAGGYSFTSGCYIITTDEGLNQQDIFTYSSFSLGPECDGVEPTGDGGFISTGRLNNGTTTTPFIFKHDCTLKTQ